MRNKNFLILSPPFQTVFSMAFLLLSFFGCQSSRGTNEVVIGAVLPLSGVQGSFGQAGKKGIQLAIEEINQASERELPRLRVVYLDDRSDTQEAMMAASRLVADSSILSVIGEISSSRSLAMAPILQKARLPMISPGATNPGVTKGRDFVFRVCFVDPFQGQVMARFARENLDIKSVAILSDVKSDYSVGLSEFFKMEFERLGGKIVVQSNYSTGDVDFKAQLTKIRVNPEVQAVFVPGSYLEVGLVARQARDLGISVPLLGGDDWDSPKLVDIGGKALEGAYFSNHFSVDDNTPSVRSFVSSYRAKFGEDPDGLSVMGYDSVKVFWDAFIRSKDRTREGIQKALVQTQDFSGAGGVLSFDSNRNAVKPAVIIQIQEGSFRFKTRLQPDSAAPDQVF